MNVLATRKVIEVFLRPPECSIKVQALRGGTQNQNGVY